MFDQGTVVKPKNEACSPLGPFHQGQCLIVVSAEAVTPTNRHPITGEYIGATLGGQFLLMIEGLSEPISSILVTRVH